MVTGQSWGRLTRARHEILALHDRHAAIGFPPGITSLPHGNGRSYGDSALNDGGRLLATCGLDRFIAFDATTGVLDCEAGVLLGTIIEQVLPRGWFLPVTPGTQFVTVGGAIANDVHGKNHHRAGSFGRHVLDFTLLRSSGERLRCSPDENAGLFAATLGGLGLTGLLLTARLQLRRCPGPAIAGESLRFANLAEFFTRARASDRDWEYTVAWVDCLASGANLGRGLLLRGNHVATDTPPPAPRLTLGVPFDPPVSLVGPATLRAFNTAYAHRPGATGARLWHWQPFFYPLDGLRQWNRLYGPRGFYQYQCVLPMANAEDGLRELLRHIAASGEGSFLAVLKLFGDLPSPGLLSFARPGATLALDFPNRGDATLQLLDRLDAITRAAGGALYPAKDARMSAAMFRASFPALDRFLPHLDPAMSSSFWRRVQPPAPSITVP